MINKTLIAILDDDERRQAQMQRALSAFDSPLQGEFFDNAPDMINWLGLKLNKVSLVSLDHDLGPNRRDSDQVFDPGTGRDVANFLAQCSPTCPVIVHSSNGFCTPGMILELESAGWSTVRVVPYNDLDWVRQSWSKSVSELCVGLD